MLEYLRSLYARAGQRYPKLVLLGSLPFAYMTGLFATAGTALYVDMSVAEFFRLVVASWLLIWTPDVLLEARVVVRRVEPVATWLAGARDAPGAVPAWHAAAGLPLGVLRHPLPYAFVVPGMALWGVYAVLELDLPAYSVAIFFMASLLIYLYRGVVRFLLMEYALRPVLEDIGSRLPDDAKLEVVQVPLRWRLLASLPAVNLITGVAVGGFSAGRGDDLAALGFALLGSAATAVLVSSWLTGFLSTSITTPITQLRDAARRVGRGELSARVPIASTDETGELAQSFNEMAAGLEQRERLREAFGAFVDPDLTDRVMAEGTDFAGEEVDLSLLFMDVRGFTTYAEQADAHEVVARLNDLYGAVVPLILRHGGHANKFIGDGLLAVFGAPNRLHDHARRAVSAACEIAETVEDRYGGELRVGVGVNSGRVVVGTIGGGGRLDFTVIGDAVNTAARVESATRQTGDTVLITAQTLEQLEGAEGWEERPAVELKGKNRPTPLFAPARAGGVGTGRVPP